MSDMPSNNIDALAAEVSGLREQLFRQIIKRDHMLFVESRQLEYAYMRLFKARECTAYDLHTKLLTGLRRQELLKAGKTTAEAEDRLQKEFAERHQIWLAQMRRRNAILEKGQPRPRDRRWFKRLNFYYAKAVALTHPDLYPALNRRQRQNMLEIAQAYKEHNLPLLSLKYDFLKLSPLPVYTIRSRAEAEREQARLNGCLTDIAAMLKALASEYPYTLRSLLYDPAARAAKHRELDELIAYLRLRLAE